MSQGRNDPCPCGSGKKFKKCCAAPPAIIPILPDRRAGRACGDCRSCCEGWLTGQIHGHEMLPGQPCHFLHDSGCSIYDTRPLQPCRTFVCGWLMPGSPFPEDDRPDRIQVILVPIDWRNQRAWVLVPAGGEPSEALLERMRLHTQTTGEPHLIKKPGRLLCYGSVAFQQDMLAKEQRGETPW